MSFEPDFKPPSGRYVSTLWFIFDKGKLLTKIEGGNYRIPETSDLEKYRLSPIKNSTSGPMTGISAMPPNWTKTIQERRVFEF